MVEAGTAGRFPDEHNRNSGTRSQASEAGKPPKGSDSAIFRHYLGASTASQDHVFGQFVGIWSPAQAQVLCDDHLTHCELSGDCRDADHTLGLSGGFAEGATTHVSGSASASSTTATACRGRGSACGPPDPDRYAQQWCVAHSHEDSTENSDD